MLLGAIFPERTQGLVDAAQEVRLGERDGFSQAGTRLTAVKLDSLLGIIKGYTQRSTSILSCLEDSIRGIENLEQGPNLRDLAIKLRGKLHKESLMQPKKK